MKKTIYRMIAILIIIGLTSFIIIEGLIFIEGRKEEETNEIDYVIVLGARLYGEIPAPALEERLNAAIEYLTENEDVRVVVTGGQGENEDIPEAGAMAKYLVDHGIDESRIIIEDQSTTTFENLEFSLEILKEIHDEKNLKVLVVTNDYHLFRSKFLAERLGMEAYGLPAQTPSSIVVQSYIREYLAVLKSFIFDR